MLKVTHAYVFKAKWQAKTENVRLDDGEGQWTHISGAEEDGTVSRNMAENLQKKNVFISQKSVHTAVF